MAIFKGTLCTRVTETGAQLRTSTARGVAILTESISGNVYWRYGSCSCVKQ
jgi:hypothetical protein